MIAKAKSISHGINDIRYITGESRNKKHPELIFHVKDNLMQPGLDAAGLWESMQLTLAGSKKVRNSVIRIEVSPAPEHTKDFTTADWEKLWDDFAREFDSIELTGKDGKVYSPKTNLRGSKGQVYLHLESRSGVPHLHAAFCRIDGQGRVNNDHGIHLRAQRAAERVARKRGWTTAMRIHERNIPQVSADCMEALRRLDRWSWNGYREQLAAKGYELYLRKDRKDVIRGYVLVKGNTKFKASELGRGRNLMAGRIESTWEKLHAASQAEDVSEQPAVREPQPAADRTAPSRAQGTSSFTRYTEYRTGTSPYRMEVDGESRRFFIPDDVLQVFNDEFDYRETANSRELTDMAVALFIGMTGVPVVPAGGGGGGGSSDLPWGRREDEDEREWARRCARAAARTAGKKTKSGRKM